MILDDLFFGSGVIPEWYTRDQQMRSIGQVDYSKRLYELEQQVAALTALVKELKTSKL